MNIAIIGAGAIGSAIARNLSKAGVAATIANSRGPESLAALHAELPNIRPVTIEEAAKADVVFLAVRWGSIPDAVRNLPAWNGRIVIDANNATDGPPVKAVDLGGRASSLVLADLLPGARVVKAFNHLLAALLQSDPRAEGGRRVLFYSGDDADAKKTVGDLIDRLGFAGIDLGTLDGGGRLAQFPGGPLPVLNLVKFG
jgi:predicted dinucleotide-binding enzyme